VSVPNRINGLDGRKKVRKESGNSYWRSISG
jgi:hypothetical protein